MGLMMRFRFTFLSLVCACLVSTAVVAQSGTFEPRELTLGLQESAPPAPTELQVQFVGYRDTRCPSNVQCAVAGEAWAFFWLTGPLVRPQVVTLRWSGGEKGWRHAVRVGTYELALFSLEPRPLQGGSVDPSEYKAVVAVRKHEPRPRAGVPAKPPSKENAFDKLGMLER